MSDFLTYPLEQTLQTAAVYPVPDERKPKNLSPGPWMPGDTKPTRNGKYLRYFGDADDSAWSWWADGEWTYDGFWRSDIQDAPWRGAVRPAHWARILELIAEEKDEANPLGYGRTGLIAKTIGLTTAQTTRLLKRMEAAGEIEKYARHSFVNCLAWRLRAHPLEGEVLLKSEWRVAGGAYGVGDLVTRDGTDVHRLVHLECDGDIFGTFLCVAAPDAGYGKDGEVCEPWIHVGEEECNLTRRYEPVANWPIAAAKAAKL